LLKIAIAPPCNLIVVFLSWPMSCEQTPMEPDRQPLTLVLGDFPDLIRIAAEELGPLLVVNDGPLTAEDAPLVRHLLVTDWNSTDLVRDLLAPMAQAHNLRAVVSYWEWALDSAAVIAEQLQLPGLCVGSSRLTRDKLHMRQRLEERGSRSTVPFMPVDSTDDIDRAARQIGLPLIVKPRRGTASLNIHHIRNADDVEASAAEGARGKSWLGYIAERFAEGTEISVEALSFGGRHWIIALTDKVTTGSPHFVEMAHFQPSLLPASAQGFAAEAVLAFLSDIDHQYGPTHTEVIVSEQGCVIVESHVRPGGDFIHELTRQTTGIDLIRSSLTYLRTGAIPEIRPTNSKHAGVKFFHFGKGKIAEIEIPPRWSEMPGYVRHRLKVAVGQTVGPLRASMDRHGHVMAFGNSRSEVEERLGSFERTIKTSLS
jgi:biotin carboxylase